MYVDKLNHLTRAYAGKYSIWYRYASCNPLKLTLIRGVKCAQDKCFRVQPPTIGTRAPSPLPQLYRTKKKKT
jgi:hypothetical protein